MKMILVAGALCAALLLAAISSVHAQERARTDTDTATPTIVVGE